MTRSILGAMALALTAAAAACSGEKQSGPDEATLNRLVECEKERDRARTATEMCTKQLDEARAGGGGAGGAASGVVVRVEGDVLTVTGTLPASGGRELTSAEQKTIYEAIVRQVRAAKPSIQRCYVSALKKNEALQARTITLKILMTIDPSGKVAGASFSPRLSGDFDECMEKITSRWKVEEYQGGSIPVEVPVTLQPAD